MVIVLIDSIMILYSRFTSWQDSNEAGCFGHLIKVISLKIRFVQAFGLKDFPMMRPGEFVQMEDDKKVMIAFLWAKRLVIN